jgi:hypothetical protein
VRRSLALVVAVGAAAAASMAAGEPVPPPQKFDHRAHVERGVVIGDACDACHRMAPDGALVPVGSVGHQPCLQADCHARAFLAAGGEGALTTERGRKAAAFCRGCHAEAPARHRKALADAAFGPNPSPGYHVELNHYRHSELARCRGCHVVDEHSFALVPRTPGHHQCAVCHGKTASPPMEACGHCHQPPGPAEYFPAEDARPPTGVRSCDSDAHRTRVAAHGADVPCFQHERQQHRFRGGSELDCGHCHYMLADAQQWPGGSRYETVKQLRELPIIDNRKNEAHRRCGDGGSCHAAQVSGISGDCAYCHSRKVASDIF